MATPRHVTFQLNGRTVEAEEGRLVIDAAKDAGVEIPHYCYHPALGNPGNCRMCVVEVAGAPKPQVSCRLAVREGLDVRSDSPAAKRAQASALELHLVNHPLDCPVCDQSGECGLQDYYMTVGRYQSQAREDKEHKSKRVEAGPHVMLDQERCILCTRCTRFVDDVTKTHELGIFGRGHEERLDLAPDKVLDNAYSGNVVDLCPVGALTDRDFRYKVRVWYLDKTDSICPGCARGCSISVHTSTKRPWHNGGRRVARLKPRYNAAVNGHWICDEGRYSYKSLDENRLGKVLRLRPSREELSWEVLAAELAGRLRGGLAAGGPEGLAVAASGALSNEDWAAFKALFVDALKLPRLYFAADPDQVGEQDELLRRREKVPNLKAAEALGLRGGSFDALAADLAAGKIWGLWVIERDLDRVWGRRAAELLAKPELTVYQSPFKGALGDAYAYRLPATAYVEEEGHFTNFEGRVQAYRRALDPIGAARPDAAIFGLVAAALEGIRSREGAAA
ncbi:MAG: (2Fe-2S)-binding protein [Elusimicrobia bacterium]|nr:(2Fe-2S)-binding protein [Elusimicrobiota bacterium]